MIRVPKPAEADALAEIHATAFSEPWQAGAIGALMAASGAITLVEDGCGFILARALADEAEILTLAVRPEARGRGVGRSLVEAAITAAKAARARAMFLEVAADNEPALALYTAAEFEQVGRRNGYYRRPGGPAMDALVFRRGL